MTPRKRFLSPEPCASRKLEAEGTPMARGDVNGWLEAGAAGAAGRRRDSSAEPQVLPPSWASGIRPCSGFGVQAPAPWRLQCGGIRASQGRLSRLVVDRLRWDAEAHPGHGHTLVLPLVSREVGGYWTSNPFAAVSSASGVNGCHEGTSCGSSACSRLSWSSPLSALGKETGPGRPRLTL